MTSTISPVASSRPIALTIAGSDSSGGAGIQADLKTFSALGVYGASVITALTAQNTTGVSAVHVAPVDIVVAQLEAVLADLTVGAVKTGMLATDAIVAAVADVLARYPAIPLVVDPVLVASSGRRLLDPAAVATLRTRLFPRATIITPNLPEAAALLGGGEAATVDEMEAQARALLAFGSAAVLLKGGHRSGSPAATDVLVRAGQPRELIEAPWVATTNTHGTGCTLSAAIAAGLASGQPLTDAVRGAKTWLTGALLQGRAQRIGRGTGPVDHMFGIATIPTKTL